MYRGYERDGKVDTFRRRSRERGGSTLDWYAQCLGLVTWLGGRWLTMLVEVNGCNLSSGPGSGNGGN